MIAPAARRAAAEAALHDVDARARLLSAWRLPAGVVDGCVGGLAIPESPVIARLVAWVGCDAPADPGEGAAARDLRVLASAPDLPSSPDARAVAALVLLSRLGEELDARERRAPAERTWARSPRDDAAREQWDALLGGGEGIAAAGRFATAWGDTVRAGFSGVAAVLRLPGQVGDHLAAAAREQFDLAVALAHLDLAARMVETTGEPIGALAAALGPAARARVDACVARRSAWRDARERLAGETTGLATGADAVVLGRLVDHLQAGRAPGHPLGLPGWGVVAANRGRMRGRLRAAATLDPAALRRSVLALDALHARTAVTVARYAWEWAWREARTSFGFDPGRLRPPPCRMGDEPPPAAPLDATDLPAVRTFLLLAAGRGAWADLVRWLGGEPGRSLGRTFYRCLEQVPAGLADAPSEAGRGYERLRRHLVDGGLRACVPALHAAARAVTPIPNGRALRAQLDEALAPWWDTSAIPRPRHHLPGFRDGVAGLLAVPLPTAGRP